MRIISSYDKLYYATPHDEVFKGTVWLLLQLDSHTDRYVGRYA